MSNPLFELEEEYSNVCDELSVWSSLVEHAGWQRLKAIAEGQVNDRIRGALRTPLASLDDVPAQEYAKGEAAGIELFQSLPEVQLEQLKANKERLEKEIENATSTTTASGVGSGSGNGNSLGGNSDGYDYGDRDHLFTDKYPTFGSDN